MMSINTVLNAKMQERNPYEEHPELLATLDRLVPKLLACAMKWRNTDPSSVSYKDITSYDAMLAILIDHAIGLAEGGAVDQLSVKTFMLVALDFANKMGSYHDER